MTDRLPCELCGPENVCTCPPCACKWCALQRGEATEFQKRQIESWLDESLRDDMQERLAKREFSQ